MKKLTWTLVLLLLALMFAGMSGGPALKKAQAENSRYQELELFTDVLSIVRKSYVEEVDFKKLIYGALEGMLATLDPHSSFMTPDIYREMKIDTEGEFGGLGIEITLKDGLLTVVAPIEDTPAHRAGLLPGDSIVRIEGRSTKDMGIMEAVKLMRGPKGSEITIGVMREAFDKPRDFTIVREVIQIKSVKFRTMEKGFGYVRISQFQAHTVEDLRKALAALREESGGSLSGLILDLRNNPGGLLDQAVAVADLFVREGLLVYTQGREPGSQMEFEATAAGTEPYYPMVALINEGSASASEIVAGALHDHDRAVIMGTQSFGKGSVQTIIPLSDDSGLRLTTARYYTPNGTSIQARGITPDLVVPRMEIRELQGPGRVRERDLQNHFETEDQPGRGAEEAQAPDEAVRSDYQLIRALDLLKGWGIFQGLQKRAA